MKVRRCAAIAAALAFALAVVALGVLWAAGQWLSQPAARAIGAAPADFGAQVVRIPLPTSEGAFVAGWFKPGQPRGGAVLLLHGVRADRTQMLARARFLAAAGYATLLIDLPAHGESSGDRITFGAREGEGVNAALAFLRAQAPGERVAVIGVSLGAASTVLALPQPEPDALVLESMFPSIEDAVGNRLAGTLGPAGRHLAPLLLWQLPLPLGVHTADLRPEARLAQWHAPVLISSGSEDRHTPWHETERLFAAAHAPKALWRVKGAAHVDLHAFAPAQYQQRVLAFLAAHLRGAPAAP